MAVSLFTSRVILQTLGVDDFGVFNIVGGVVISLSFISNTLISSTQRFMSYELGLGEKVNVYKVFSMSINIHAIFILVVLFLLESIGLYFLNNVLDVPEDRIFAANIVYQLSIITFCINIIRIPYNALIISNERMSIYAYLSILEVGLRLLIVYLIPLFPDKLIAYGAFILIVTLLINFTYIIYCRKEFPSDSKYHFEKNSQLFKSMFGFSGWTLVGGVAGMISSEGPNFLMNIFLGVRINAAMAIAKQVSAAVYSFASNFQTAFNPQIVKTYAEKDYNNLYSIIFKTSKLSYYLLVIFAIPLILFATPVFNLWLDEVPDHAISLSILFLLSFCISAIGSPLWMLAHATGDIKKYQLVLSSFSLVIIPIGWLLLKLNFEPESIIVLLIIINVFVLIYRVSFLKQKMNFPVGDYYKLIARCGVVTLICIVPSYLLSLVQGEVVTSLSLMVASFIICVLIIFFVDIDKNTRRDVLFKIKSFLTKKL